MYSSIASIGIAVPPCCVSQAQAEQFVDKYHAEELLPRSKQILHKVLKHPSIKKRYFAVDNPEVLPVIKQEDPDKRVSRFLHWSRLLGSQAIKSALSKCNLGISDISALFVNTCTGYICPGISTYLIEDLGFSNSIKAYDLVGSGCGGAVPNLQLASQFCLSHPGTIALSVSIEICSATYQMDNDLSLILSNAIFGDGAAAVVIWDQPKGVELVCSDQLFLPEFREHVRYVHKGGQLHNQISKRLPEIIGNNVGKFVSKLISKQNLSLNEISHFFIHPGGDKILDKCSEVLSISEDKMKLSRSILEDYGNCSSPSVLFEVNREFEQIKRGQWGILLSFGAGLSMYGWLLRGN